MNNVARWQFTRSGRCRLTNSYRTVRLTFFLNCRSTTAPDCTGNSSTQHEVVVGRIHDGVDILVDKIARNDHDTRRIDASTSATR